MSTMAGCHGRGDWIFEEESHYMLAFRSAQKSKCGWIIGIQKKKKRKKKKEGITVMEKKIFKVRLLAKDFNPRE